MMFVCNHLLSLMRFWCLFVSKKTPNNAVTPQSSTVLIVLVDDGSRRPAQWVRSSFAASQHCLASFWRQTNIKISRDFLLVTNKHQKSHEIQVPQWPRASRGMKPRQSSQVKRKHSLLPCWPLPVLCPSLKSIRLLPSPLCQCAPTAIHPINTPTNCFQPL